MLPLQSTEIDKLTQAFVEARKGFKFVKEDSKANYGSFVSLEEIKYATNESLLANGLSLTQGRTIVEGAICLVTRLTHTSGQWIASYVPLVIPEMAKDINQEYGKAMSYQRRYELYGLFSIKGEENDPDSVRDDQSRPTASPGKSVPSSDSNCISEKQYGMLKAILNGDADREAKICAHYKIESLAQLPWKHMQEVVNKLKGA